MKICKCGEEMTIAEVAVRGAFSLIKTKKNTFDILPTKSEILTYVCPKCGKIEFFAENPEIFNKD